MRAEDLFFLQIQGSGVLVFEDGRRARAVFDGSNGAPFVGVAAPMRQEGLLPDRRTSGGDIHAWLADHRGPEAQAVMDQNPRYVFFRLAPDTGTEPPGAAGRPLVPGDRWLSIPPLTPWASSVDRSHGPASRRRADLPPAGGRAGHRVGDQGRGARRPLHWAG